MVQITLQPLTENLVPFGSPIPLEVSSFDEERQAKLRTYSRVQAFSDTSLILGAFNSTYTITTIVPQDFTNGEDIETLLAGLKYPLQQLTDVDGTTDLIRITQTSTSHTGGIIYVYTVDIAAVSLERQNINVAGHIGVHFVYSQPVTITTGYLNLSPTREVVYANGNWWAFYSDGASKIYYQTSSDGANWNVPIVVTSSTGAGSGYDFTVWQNGSTIYYALSSNLVNKSFIWNQGTLQSNGLIAWLGENTVATGVLYTGNHISICLDTNGYIWVAFTSGTTGVGAVYVTQDGVHWSQSTTLAATGYYENPIAILPFTGGKLIVWYGDSDAGDVVLRNYNGSVWGSPPIGIGQYLDGAWSVITIGDTAYFLGSATGQSSVDFFTYTYGGVFSPVTHLLLTGGYYYWCTIGQAGTDLVAAFGEVHATANVYYKTSSDSGVSWSALQVASASESSLLSILSPYQTPTTAYGLYWQSSPNKIRFFPITG